MIRMIQRNMCPFWVQARRVNELSRVHLVQSGQCETFVAQGGDFVAFLAVFRRVAGMGHEDALLATGDVLGPIYLMRTSQREDRCCSSE
jgi:hypothetical protein